ncbi:BRO-N domain-containing protein [Pseudomonas sp. TCU-HL1]|uniref:BRO-N domain-containing protein n=1 Tax=Pseudomonas sp. TCU-HL1 TaxID=1856685 RepID=UPI00083D2107|nr:BRO family protein [Pseudomonas sp. TCU-HL1]AOE84024.1 antirepressor [Pseudomonas sp. TCU-HL1]
MHDAYTPIVFHHHAHRLRALMIDHQPWFVAHDFARLMGVRNARRLLHALERFEKRTVLLANTSGFHEEVDAISDAGAYKALFRFARPDYAEISRWLSEVLVPTLHDYHRDPGAAPRRAFIHWADRQIGVVRWQRELWVAWRDLPAFMVDGAAVSA